MSKKQKLELTWIGKDKRPKLEPRILLEDPARSYHTHIILQALSDEVGEGRSLLVLCGAFRGVSAAGSSGADGRVFAREGRCRALPCARWMRCAYPPCSGAAPRSHAPAWERGPAAPAARGQARGCSVLLVPTLQRGNAVRPLQRPVAGPGGARHEIYAPPDFRAGTPSGSKRMPMP